MSAVLTSLVLRALNSLLCGSESLSPTSGISLIRLGRLVPVFSSSMNSILLRYREAQVEVEMEVVLVIE